MLSLLALLLTITISSAQVLNISNSLLNITILQSENNNEIYHFHSDEFNPNCKSSQNLHVFIKNGCIRYNSGYAKFENEDDNLVYYHYQDINCVNLESTEIVDPICSPYSKITLSSDYLSPISLTVKSSDPTSVIDFHEIVDSKLQYIYDVLPSETKYVILPTGVASVDLDKEDLEINLINQVITAIPKLTATCQSFTEVSSSTYYEKLKPTGNEYVYGISSDDTCDTSVTDDVFFNFDADISDESYDFLSNLPSKVSKRDGIYNETNIQLDYSIVLNRREVKPSKCTQTITLKPTNVLKCATTLTKTRTVTQNKCATTIIASKTNSFEKKPTLNIELNKTELESTGNSQKVSSSKCSSTIYISSTRTQSIPKCTSTIYKTKTVEDKKCIFTQTLGKN